MDMRNNFYMENVAKLWNGVARAAVESPSLEGFKGHVDVAPGDMV